MSALLHFAVLAAFIVAGSRLGGVGLGLAGGAGLVVLSFGLGVPPSQPPIKVIVIILAVITAAAAVEAAGGTRYLIHRAERGLRRHPAWISISAPCMTFLATVFCGTGYVSLALFPVIAEVAAKAGVPPERPLSSSLIAIQQAITVSPLSAATATMVLLLAPHGISWLDILAVTLPASLAGTLAAILSVARRAPRRVPTPAGLPPTAHGEDESRRGRRAVLIFSGLIAIVVCLGAFDSLRPSAGPGHQAIDIARLLPILMLGGAWLIVTACGIEPERLIETSVFRSGSLGAISVFGVAWMSDSVIAHHQHELLELAGDWAAHCAWGFALLLFAGSALLFSQAAAVAAIVPLGLAIGVPAPTIVGVFTACTGYFLLPSGALTLACASFDPTGGTRIGRFLFDHSFLRPGLCAVLVSVSVGIALQDLLTS